MTVQPLDAPTLVALVAAAAIAIVALLAAGVNGHDIALAIGSGIIGYLSRSHSTGAPPQDPPA